MKQFEISFDHVCLDNKKNIFASSCWVIPNLKCDCEICIVSWLWNKFGKNKITRYPSVRKLFQYLTPCEESVSPSYTCALSEGGRTGFHIVIAWEQSKNNNLIEMYKHQNIHIRLGRYCEDFILSAAYVTALNQGLVTE